MQPSVKGHFLHPAIRQLNRGIADGKIALSELEFRLESEDLDLLDAEGSIESSLWYPVVGYDRLLETLRDLGGKGEDHALVTFARKNAAKLLHTAPYESLVENADGSGDRVGAGLVKFSELAFNFTRWEYESDSHADFRVHVSDAREFPETLRWFTQGLMETLASEVLGEPVSISHERLSQDHIVYHGSATPDR